MSVIELSNIEHKLMAIKDCLIQASYWRVKALERFNPLDQEGVIHVQDDLIRLGAEIAKASIYLSEIKKNEG